MVVNPKKNSNVKGSVKTSGVSNNASVSQVPTGVKAIAVLYYVSAGFSLLMAISLIVIGLNISNSAEGFEVIELLVGLGFAIFVILAVIILAIAILQFFIGKGLWKAKNWARILVIIFSIIGIIISLLGLTQGVSPGNIVSLALGGLIVWYLMFNQSVKSAFA